MTEEGPRPLKSRKVRVKILGKMKSQVGWIFKRDAFTVAYEIVGELCRGRRLFQAEVPFFQYAALKEGEEYLMSMYSVDGKLWYRSEEEAAL
jgi:hypothetical protein